MDVAGHDADLAGSGGDDAGAIGADQARLALAEQRVLHLDHVLLGDTCRNMLLYSERRNSVNNNVSTFRDTDNQRNLCVQSLEDGGRGAGGRDVDDGSVRVDLGLGLQHRVEHGEAEVHLAALARGHAAHHVGAVLQRLLGVEGALLAGEALADDLGLLGQPHVGPRLGVTCPHSAQSTACLAAFG